NRSGPGSPGLAEWARQWVPVWCSCARVCTGAVPAGLDISALFIDPAGGRGMGELAELPRQVSLVVVAATVGHLGQGEHATGGHLGGDLPGRMGEPHQ